MPSEEEAPLGSEEAVSIKITRYRDLHGEMTCAADFSKGRICRFLGNRRFGTVEVCLIPDEGGEIRRIARRKEGKGTLVPREGCLVWSEK